MTVKLNNSPSELFKLNFIQPNNQYNNTIMALPNLTCVRTSSALVELITKSY